MFDDANLSITARYTSATWHWAGFEGADLLISPEAKTVFRATNGALDLVRLVRRRLPSLRHSLAQRHAMLDHRVREAPARRVLELAAGLCARGIRLTSDPAWTCIEVDLPSMVEEKESLLAQSSAGQEVLIRPKLKRIAGDALDLDLEALLPGPEPVTITAEGLLMYLDAEQQGGLWKRLASLCTARPGSRLLFDLVPSVEQAPPGPLGHALGAAMKLFTRGQGFASDARGREQILEGLLSSGFQNARHWEPQDLPQGTVPFLDKPTQTLVFEASVSVSEG